MLVGIARAVGEKASACAGERVGGACVPHERGRGRLRHCHTFRSINFRVTVQAFGLFESRHADVDRLFRGGFGFLARPWRCEDLQRKPCYSGRVLAGRTGAFSAPGDPGWRFCWSQGVRHAGRQKAPSAIRCIKTVDTRPGLGAVIVGQKAPSAIRCIKTLPSYWCASTYFGCQKAPSAIRCIKTQPRAGTPRRVGALSEST